MEHINSKQTIQELILVAMDGRTQKQFAQECGLSKEHLCRLLDINNTRKPSKQTLLKIYKAGKGKVLLQDLYDVCDYFLEKELDTNSDKIELAVAARKSVLALNNVFSELLSEFNTYDNITDLMKKVCGRTGILKDIFVFSNYKILVENHNYKGNYKGEKAVIVEFNRDSFLGDIDGKYYFYYVIYYVTTGCNKLMLTDYSSNVAALMEQKGLPKTLKLLIQKDNLYNNKYLTILEKYTPQYLNKLKDIEEKNFLYTYGILNGSTPINYIESNNGPGFYVEYIPDKFRKFLDKHKNTFNLADYEEIAVRNYLNGMSLLDAFDYMNDTNLLNKTYKTTFDFCFKSDVEKEEELICIIITEILKRELKRDYYYYLATSTCLEEEKRYNNKTCIMEYINKNILSDKGVKAIETGIALLQPYAKELGIEYVENCYFFRAEIYTPCKTKID